MLGRLRVVDIRRPPLWHMCGPGGPMTPEQRATLERLLGRTPSDGELLTDVMVEALCALSDRLDAYDEYEGPR